MATGTVAARQGVARDAVTHGVAPDAHPVRPRAGHPTMSFRFETCRAGHADDDALRVKQAQAVLAVVRFLTQQGDRTRKEVRHA